MKRMFTKMLLPVAMFAVLTGCKKDDDTSAQQPTPLSPTETFNYGDAWGLLAAVKTVTSQSTPIGPIEIEVGTAVAAFNTTEGGDQFYNAGTISCKSKTLTIQSNNSYVFQPSQTDATGIDYSNGIANWNGSGSSDVPAFSASLTAFPSTPTLNSGDVTLSSGHTVSFGSVNNADSILVVLASGSNYIKKTVGGNATSATFSASELSTLSASDMGMVQVTPYWWEPRFDIILGKKVYMVNQVTVTNFVKFQ